MSIARKAQLYADARDRLLGRGTSGELIASMERRVASPAYGAERDAFYATLRENDKLERAKQEARWATEEMGSRNAVQ